MASLAATGDGDSDSYWVNRLTRYYEKYNPDKIKTVDAALTKYKGFEIQLFKALVEKYGPEPEPEEDALDGDEGQDEDEDEDRDEDKDKDEDEDEDEDESGSGSGSEEEEEDDDADAGAIAYADLDEDDFPFKVPLCPNCGLPFEYCEYSMTASFSKCLVYLLAERPNMMLQKKCMTVAEFCQKNDKSGAGGDGAGESKVPAKKEGKATTGALDYDPNDPRAKKKAEKRERKRLAAEAKAKAKAAKSGGRTGPIVSVSIKNRTKRKYIVNIFGLDKFGVKLKDAGKRLSKKYACSATVSKNSMGQKEVVMSGDIGYDISDVIHKFYPNIPKDAIVIDKKVKKEKKKIPGQMDV